MRFDRYLFICINERPKGHPRGSCGTSGSLELLEAFKAAVAARGLKTKIRVNKAGCMEVCELGPSVMVHPDNVWYQKVRIEDVEAIVEEHLIGGVPVERLKTDFGFYKRA
jgi:(2Fe-2S) ferredoxin